MKAGFDFGSTLTKVVWHKGDYHYASTADQPLESILDQIKQDGVKTLNITGIGYFTIPLPEDFIHKFPQGDPLEQETHLQARGAKKLLELEGKDLQNILIVSIGTGTSFTFFSNGQIEKYPFGNSQGGGYLEKQAIILGLQNYQELAQYAERGTPCDLLVKDKIPATVGSLYGEIVIANFGRATKETSKEDLAASSVNQVAVAIIRDMMKMNLMEKYKVPNDIVFVGSTVKAFPYLREKLSFYNTFLGKNLHFPSKGEFASALGAYHSED